MALTRKALKAMGLTEEQVDSIIDLHLEVKNDLEEQIKKYKDDAGKLEGVQKELDELKAKPGGEDWKGKYEAEKAAHDKTRNEYAAKESAAKVQEAYAEILKGAGVAEKYLKTALRATDLSQMKMGEDGKLEGAEELTKSAKEAWADFIPVKGKVGANPATPPNTSDGRMTREEIYKKDDHGRYVLSTAERQKALAEAMQAGDE